MAFVNEYLKKLLYHYDCVVVPELGAFLTHFQPAAFMETSGLYLPPRKRVAFNEALRLDDGILANYIMLHEPVTREGAQRHISLFVSELRRQVAQTGRFDMTGIGTFTRNDEGRLQFDPSLRHNFFGEAYGMYALSVQSVNQQLQEEPVLEAVPITVLGPVLTREDDAELIPFRPARPYWRVAAVALLIGSLGAISYFSVVKPGQPLQGTLDPAPLLHASASFLKRSSDTKEAPVVAVIPAVHRPAPVTEAVAEKKPVPTPVQPAVVAPTPAVVNATPAPVHKPVVHKPEPSVTAKPIRTEPHFTVIAGVFQSKQNALRLRGQLRQAGFTDAYVIVPQSGQKDVYKVAAIGSPVRSEAIVSMDSINRLTGAKAWLFEH